MSLIEINWQPSRKDLRHFGIIALVASVLIAAILHTLKGLGLQTAAITLAAGLIIFLSSLFSVRLTRIIYLGLVLATLPIGWVVSFVLLATFYFLLITPVAMIFRLIGRDPLRRKFDPNAETYWVRHRPPDNLERYFHQF